MRSYGVNIENLSKFIIEELGDWQHNVTRLLQESVRKNKLTLTDELLNSFEHEVKSHAGDMVQGLLSFRGYGRIKEMSRLVYTRQPPVEKMEEYVEKVGVSKFKYVPGYKAGHIPHESIAVKRIAWGLARRKFIDNKHKPKRWFAKQFYREVNILVTNLMIGYQEAIANSTTNKFKSLS
jgi:hypothetical protein